MPPSLTVLSHSVSRLGQQFLVIIRMPDIFSEFHKALQFEVVKLNKGHSDERHMNRTRSYKTDSPGLV